MAKVGYDTFDKDLQNKLMIAQQADSNTLNRQQMLSDMLGQQQNTISGALAGAQGVQNLGMGQFMPLNIPWDYMNNYASAIGAPTVLSSGNSGCKSKGIAQSASAGL